MTKRIERLRLRSVNRVGEARWGAVRALLSVAGSGEVNMASSPATATAGERVRTSGRKKLIGNARAARKAAKRRPVAMAGR